MELRRSTWATAVRLAVALSLAATAAAWALHSIGGLSQTTIVLGVIVVGFVTSWVRTGRVAHDAPVARPHTHRVATVRVHGAHDAHDARVA